MTSLLSPRRSTAGYLVTAMTLVTACGRSDLATRASEPKENWQSLSRSPAPVVDSTPAPAEEIPAEPTPPAQTQTVILISVDGMAPRFLDAHVNAGKAPSFLRLQEEGLFTHNAHTEVGLTVTLPNHTSMLTGRPATPPPSSGKGIAHGVTPNYDTGGVVHEFGDPPRYLPSVFDSVHDRDGCTAFHGGKDKLLLIARAYDSEHGGEDRIAPDNGRSKIDIVAIEPDTPKLLSDFKSTLQELAAECQGRPKFLFLHFRDTDSEGHLQGWGSPAYLSALTRADRLVGEVMESIKENELLGDAVLLVTSDHGGTGTGHYDQSDPNVFRIPFYVWTPAGAAGDLYQHGAGRVDPLRSGPILSDKSRPLRNGDAANLALHLLGMPPLRGSYHTGFSLPVTAREEK